MLTNTTKFINFKNEFTPQDLELLCNKLINVQLKDSDSTSGRGFNAEVAEEIIKHVTLAPDGKVLVINDFSLNMYYELRKLGYEHKNIILAFGEWQKGKKDNISVSSSSLLYRHMFRHLVTCFKEFMDYSDNIIELKEIYNMHFDLIISNPPYRTIGADITKNIIDNVSYKEFINLLPIADYLKNKYTINFVKDSFRVGSKAFEKQASIDPYICHISKTKCNDYNKELFCVNLQYEGALKNYYLKNYALKGTEVGFLNCPATATKEEFYEKFNSSEYNKDTNFLVTYRTLTDGVHQIEGRGATDIDFNVRNVIDFKDLHVVWDKYLKCWHGSSDFLTLKSSECKKNLVDFWYRNNGNNLMNRFLKGMHKQGGAGGACLLAVPQVDWSHPWTECEILKEYGYSEDEIDYILSDEFLAEVERN